MPTFPTFDGGIVTQRPWSFGTRWKNQVTQIEHGPKHVYTRQSAVIRAWEVNYPNITDSEVGALHDFFYERHGRTESFDFTDPDSGTTYSNCRFDQDELTITASDIDSNSVRVSIVQFQS